MHDLSITYVINNDEYPKALQEAVDIMHKVKFKSEHNNEKSNTQKQNKMEVVSKVNRVKRVFHKHRNMKNCYFCGSGTHILNNWEIKDTKSRYQWFDKTGNVQIHHQQAEYKGSEQTGDSDTDVSVSSTKTSGWGGLKISSHRSKQVTKEDSYLIEMIMMDSGTTINIYGNPKIITSRQKADIPMNLLTNTGSKIVDEVGKIL